MCQCPHKSQALPPAGQAPGEAAGLSLPGQVCRPSLSSGQKRLSPQGPGPFSSPQAPGTTQLEKSLAKETGVSGGSQSGGLDQALWIPALPHSLWVGPGCLRTRPGACEVHKTWLAQGAGRGSAGGGLPAGSLQAAAGVIVSPSPSVNAEPIEAETQTVPTGPLAKGGVARPGQNHWLCKQQGLLCLGGAGGATEEKGPSYTIQPRAGRGSWQSSRCVLRASGLAVKGRGQLHGITTVRCLPLLGTRSGKERLEEKVAQWADREGVLG